MHLVVRRDEWRTFARGKPDIGSIGRTEPRPHGNVCDASGPDGTESDDIGDLKELFDERRDRSYWDSATY